MAKRPASVSIVVFLTWLSAILNIIFGGWALIAAQSLADEAVRSTSEIRVEGAISLILGLILALLASGLGHGSKVARLIVSVVMVLRLVSGALLAIFAFGTVYGWVGLVSVLIALAVLWLLWNAKAGAFFSGGTLVKD